MKQQARKIPLTWSRHVPHFLNKLYYLFTGNKNRHRDEIVFPQCLFLLATLPLHPVPSHKVYVNQAASVNGIQPDYKKPVLFPPYQFDHT